MTVRPTRGCKAVVVGIALALTTVGSAYAADTGSVNAAVTISIASPLACIVLTKTTMDFGTVTALNPAGDDINFVEESTPLLQVNSCSSSLQGLSATATKATFGGVEWNPTSAANSGQNLFRLAVVPFTGPKITIGPTSSPSPFFTLPAGQAWAQPFHFYPPKVGSQIPASGSQMGFTISIKASVASPDIS